MIQTLLQSPLALADRWLGSALSQVVLLFLGLLLGILVVAGLWERRLKSLGAVIGLTFALLLAGLALGESIGGFFGAMDMLLRLRLLAFFLGLFILGITLNARFRFGLGIRLGTMWGSTALLLLCSSLFARSLSRFPSLLGLGYGAVILALLLLFLLLFAFHVSLVLAEQQLQRQALEQRLRRVEQRVGLAVPTDEGGMVPPERHGGVKTLLNHVLHPVSGESQFRRWRGTTVAVPAIIFLAVLSVTTVGLMAPQVMIGDEVTHFYMLETQSRNMLQPNFIAEIPFSAGGFEQRRYPHSFFWHYFGALCFLVSGGSFAAVQLYQAFFLAQFLCAAYLLARGRGGVSTRSALLYLLTLASLPMSLIFSVTFYQDVPMAAQVLTAFWLLQRRRWLWATLCMALALWIKVNALLFYPIYCVYLLQLLQRGLGWRRMVVPAFGAGLVLLVSTWTLGWCIEHYSGAEFYPTTQARKLLHKIVPAYPEIAPGGQMPQSSRPLPADSIEPARPQEGAIPLPPVTPSAPARVEPRLSPPVQSEQVAEIIANHPGDLRQPINFFVYGGLLLWLVVLVGLAQPFLCRRWPSQPLDRATAARQDWLWPLAIGASYSLAAAWMLRTAPDARFFLPGLPFLLLPLCERAVRLPRIKPVLALLASLAILQGGYVLHKTYRLRQVSDELRAVIAYLAQHPPTPARVFMYPEGNYRLFPVVHEWYLDYRLRDFWHADNDKRLRMLAAHQVGALVIKKHLIAPVDDAVTDLGVYPDYFVRQIGQDSRFLKVFDNGAAVVYRIAE
ncbi:MAG: hypothetical protein BWK76_16040 [Desulfobulbaceae bacterium A2]|nr:MAG: hypothetical protein BWK76_16040 [Desulfobulbaceae bacterium A2]